MPNKFCPRAADPSASIAYAIWGAGGRRRARRRNGEQGHDCHVPCSSCVTNRCPTTHVPHDGVRFGWVITSALWHFDPALLAPPPPHPTTGPRVAPLRALCRRPNCGLKPVGYTGRAYLAGEGGGGGAAGLGPSRQRDGAVETVSHLRSLMTQEYNRYVTAVNNWHLTGLCVQRVCRSASTCQRSSQRP
eukprot:365119-Chlamydomonas_euryale.AAC.8